MMVKTLKVLFLLVLPLVFLVSGFRFDRTKYGTDPESAYLLNGLNIANGRAVGHYDNPGTTVQMFSALVLRVTHAFRPSHGDITTDVLHNSEFYIEVLRYSFIVLNACILFLFGFLAFRWMGTVWAGLLLQAAPFLSVTLLEECFTKVAPEQFLLSGAILMALLLMKYLYRNTGSETRYALLFGLLGGFGLATKLTFLPLLVIPFVVLKGWKSKWLFAGAVLPSFVLFTLPAVTGYANMAYWFLNLGTHTGTYGQGNAGFIDPAVYLRSIVNMAVVNKAMVLIMFVSAVVLIWDWIRRRRQETGVTLSAEGRVLLAVLLAQAGSILMVAKHYHNNHYLFPALTLCGFALLLIWRLIFKSESQDKPKTASRVLPFLVVAVAGLSLLNLPAMTMAFEGYRASNRNTDEAFARLDREYTDYVRIYYYPASFNVYSSLRWGNVYSRQYSTPKLREFYPEGIFYNVLENQFQEWEVSLSASELLRKYGPKLLMVGGPMTEDDYQKVQKNGLKLSRLFDGRIQVVYRIDTASAIFKPQQPRGTVVWKLENDLETLSADSQWILSADGSHFSAGSSLEKGQARSGNNAFFLPANEGYAMEYLLPDVKAGQEYSVSMWRSPGVKDGFIALTGSPADPFYAQSQAFSETDDKGWQRVVLDFKIPDGFKGNSLKVYLWNHGNKPARFDDFSITRLGAESR
jgi:hypothetical protein